jgi:hypothetical protein
MSPRPARKYDQRGASGDLHLPARDLAGHRVPPLHCVAFGGSENQGPFLDWNTAQSGFRAASQNVEASLATEFGKKQIAVRPCSRPLRPLNNTHGRRRGHRNRAPFRQA